MPAKLYKVTLTEEERADLSESISKGKIAARKVIRTRILLLADEGNDGTAWKDGQIVEALGTSRRTVERTRQVCVEKGIEAALNHKQRYRHRAKVLDGQAEAHLVKVACSQAPEGRERWTLQLLTDKLIELEVVEQVSYETIRTTLKKMNLSLG